MKSLKTISTHFIHQSAKAKDNKIFLILSALGILFVIDDHTGESIGIFTQIFPYDSFYMPMFVFISGYFFSLRNCETWLHFVLYIKRKFVTSIIPFLFWVLFYGVLTTLFQVFNIFQIGRTDLRDLIYNLITSGGSFSFNDSTWFIPMLFGVIVTYHLIRKVFMHCWNDYVAMILLAVLGAGSVYLAQIGWIIPKLYMVYKVAFFLQFYQLAVLFRNKLETTFDRISPLWICLATVTGNLILIHIYGNAIEFPLCATMRGFQSNNAFLPLITSISAIAFWLKIARILVPVMGNNTLINFISNHTAFLMTHHLLVKHLFIGILIGLRNCGMSIFEAIDVVAYRCDAWYVYGEYRWCMILSFIFTVCVCMLFAHCCDIVKLKLSTKKQLP